MPVSKALCILDGKQASTTCAVLAYQQFDEVHALICEDGRQSPMAVESASLVADFLPLASREIVDLASVLPSATLMPQSPLDLRFSIKDLGPMSEVMFTSTRQIMLLTLAAERAAIKGIQDVFVGLSEADFPDYYQHHQTYIALLARVLGEGLWRDPEALTIHTPLLTLSRADMVRLGVQSLNGRFPSLFELTHDCEREIEGGCGACYGCLTRDRGFQEIPRKQPLQNHRASLQSDAWDWIELI
jgi:7-cyano-7-deazaguanine synthase